MSEIEKSHSRKTLDGIQSVCIPFLSSSSPVPRIFSVSLLRGPGDFLYPLWTRVRIEVGTGVRVRTRTRLSSSVRLWLDLSIQFWPLFFGTVFLAGRQATNNNHSPFTGYP